MGILTLTRPACGDAVLSNYRRGHTMRTVLAQAGNVPEIMVYGGILGAPISCVQDLPQTARMGEGQGRRPSANFVGSDGRSVTRAWLVAVRHLHNATKPPGDCGSANVFLISRIVRDEKTALAWTPDCPCEPNVAP